MYEDNHIKPDYLEVNNVDIGYFEVLNELYDNITILKFCELVGIPIPRFCFHPELVIAGNCRMCLIELRGTSKPLIACATTLKQQQAIYTNSTLVKMARESVLEFLLINHPLDCPICDQGGECDLQDISFVYGSDRGRFNEAKRSVTDITISPLIKTIMTRCIHCTRCVRYFDDAVGVSVLGTMGRGGATEIGTYVDILLNSGVVGNVIDLCPVGALTSKPYAFFIRPWELDHMESIDILDSYCSRIRIDTRGNAIVRILPKFSTRANRGWITDRARFFYEGVMRQRAMNPLINLNRISDSAEQEEIFKKDRFYRCSWQMAFSYIISAIHLCFWEKKRMLAFSSIYSDLHSAISMISLCRNLGVGDVDINIAGNSETDSRKDYIIPIPEYRWTNEWMITHYFIYAGYNPRHESPVFNIRLRAFHLKNPGHRHVFIIGEAYPLNLKSVHVGATDLAMREALNALSIYSLACVENDPVSLIGPSIALSGSKYDYRQLLSFVLFNSLIHLIVHKVVPYTGDMSVFEWGCPVEVRVSSGLRATIHGSNTATGKFQLGFILLHENDHLVGSPVTKPTFILPKHLFNTHLVKGGVLKHTSKKLPLFEYVEWEDYLFKRVQCHVTENELVDECLDGIILQDDVFVVYIGAHIGFGAQVANVVIPTQTFVERLSHHISCSGEVLFTTPAIVVSNRIPDTPIMLTLLRLFINEYYPHLSTVCWSGVSKFIRSSWFMYDIYHNSDYKVLSDIDVHEESPRFLATTPLIWEIYQRLRHEYGLDREEFLWSFSPRFLFDPENVPDMYRHEHEVLLLRMYGIQHHWSDALSNANEFEYFYERLLRLAEAYEAGDPVYEEFEARWRGQFNGINNDRYIGMDYDIMYLRPAVHWTLPVGYKEEEELVPINPYEETMASRLCRLHADWEVEAFFIQFQTVDDVVQAQEIYHNDDFVLDFEKIPKLYYGDPLYACVLQEMMFHDYPERYETSTSLLDAILELRSSFMSRGMSSEEFDHLVQHNHIYGFVMEVDPIPGRHDPQSSFFLT